VRESNSSGKRVVVSKAHEDARLRGEGLSLRAIGERLGVDQRQVQRWLKAAGQAKPARVTGRDGRRYRGARVSAAGGASSSVADKEAQTAYSWDLSDLSRQYEGLRALQRATAAEFRALRRAAIQGVPPVEGARLAAEARRRVLSAGKLWDDSVADSDREDGELPDDGLELLLVHLAEWLTTDGVELLCDDLADELGRRGVRIKIDRHHAADT
jgi:hypothetical protein